MGWGINGARNESAHCLLCQAFPKASAIPICYARAQSRNCASICTGTDREIVQAPRPAGVRSTGRDLSPRTLAGGRRDARCTFSSMTMMLQLRALSSDHPEDGPLFDQVAL